MLELDWKTLLFQIANFVALVFILDRVLFRSLGKKLDERQRVIGEKLESARDQEADAERLRRDLEEHRERIETEAERTLRQAQAEAAEQSEALFEEARERLDRLTDEMREDILRQRNEVVAENYEEILDTVIALSGSVVQSVTTRRTHDDLVTNFCASIYQLPQADVEDYRRLISGRVPTAFVKTPVALTAEQTQTLEDTLSSLIDRRMELEIETDPSLIAGIQVRLADKLIDNSVRKQLDRIRAQVRNDLVSRIGVEGSNA